MGESLNHGSRSGYVADLHPALVVAAMFACLGLFARAENNPACSSTVVLPVSRIPDGSRRRPFDQVHAYDDCVPRALHQLQYLVVQEAAMAGRAGTRRYGWIKTVDVDADVVVTSCGIKFNTNPSPVVTSRTERMVEPASRASSHPRDWKTRRCEYPTGSARSRGRVLTSAASGCHAHSARRAVHQQNPGARRFARCAPVHGLRTRSWQAHEWVILQAVELASRILRTAYRCWHGSWSYRYAQCPHRRPWRHVRPACRSRSKSYAPPCRRKTA